MIRPDYLLTGASEIATLARGPVPRVGPAASELGILRHGSIALQGGRIVALGSDRAVAGRIRRPPADRVIDLTGSVVVPAFVDAHTHALFAGSRAGELPAKIRGATYLEIARAGGGIYRTVRATRRAPAERLIRESSDRLAGAARGGSRTVEVKTGYALSHTGELRLLTLLPAIARRTGLRIVPTYLGAHAVPPEATGRRRDYVNEIVRRTIPWVALHRLARFVDVFCEPGFFTVAEAERILVSARAAGLGIKIHADEFVVSGGAALAARLRARSADHLLMTPPEDRRALARAGVTAVLLPATPWAALASARSPGREMIDAGVPVALGTDLSPNSWVERMPTVLAHAVYSARLTPAEALTAATVNAAHALDRPLGEGMLREGGPADLSVFPFDSVGELGYRIDPRPTRIFRQGRPVFLSELRAHL
ncbi:MAG: imidazolonepropionase [Thermoplasmata archaeon]